MAKLPGSSGMALLGDKSLEFYRDPVGFYERRIKKHGSRIFEARLLNKSTSFVCSVQGMKELLCEKSSIFQKDPTDVMHHLYGDNIVTSTGEEACLLRLSLTHLFTGKCLQSSAEYINRVCENCLKGLSSSLGPLSIYPLFKQLGTELVLGMFLNVHAQESPQLFQQISELCTQHWHALEAKNKLLEIIHDKLESEEKGFVADMKALPLPDDSYAPQHLLLFISALIPKALASVLTSFTLALSGPSRQAIRDRARKDPEYFNHVLLEVQRLWPPFIGGRRIANQDTSLGSFRISKGYATMFISHAVHRDPEVFHQPEEFLPERWSGRNAGQEHLLCTQGNGPRNCIGTQLNQHFLEAACGYLLKHYDWDLSPASQDLQYKWLPISRPIHPPIVSFRELDCSTAAQPEGGSSDPGTQ